MELPGPAMSRQIKPIFCLVAVFFLALFYSMWFMSLRISISFEIETRLTMAHGPVRLDIGLPARYRTTHRVHQFLIWELDHLK